VSDLKASRPAVGVARGASYLLIQNVAVLIISLAAFAVIARAITRADLGTLAILTLVAGGAQLMSGLGVGSTATQFVASLEGQGNHKDAARAGYGCIIINTCMTAIVLSAVFLLSGSFASFLLGTVSKANLFRLLTWEIAVLGLGVSLGNILLGFKRFREYSFASAASFAIRQGAVVALLILGMGVPGVLIGWAIGDSVNDVLMAFFARKALGPFQFGFGFPKLLRFSAPLFLGDIANFAWTFFDRALLIPLVSLSQLGAYSVAITAYGVLKSVPSSVSAVLFPFFSHLYGGGKDESGVHDLENAVKTASRYLSFLTVPLAVGLAVTAFPTAVLLAGSNYFDAALPLAVLCIFLALGCLTSALGQIFVVLSRTVTAALVTIASIILPTVIGFLVIPYLGIVGAAMARGISILIELGISIVILRNILKLKFDLRAFGHAWAASLIMGAVVLAIEAVFYSKYLLPLYIVAGALVFLISLRFLRAATPDDIELLSNFLTPRLRFLSRWLAKGLDVKIEPD
jgi:O-antigen/teichoic acid export membrane protein